MLLCLRLVPDGPEAETLLRQHPGPGPGPGRFQLGYVYPRADHPESRQEWSSTSLHLWMGKITITIQSQSHKQNNK